MTNPFEQKTPPSIEKPKIYQAGKFTFNFENTENEHVINITKKVLDTLAPFLETPVHIQFKPMNPEEPGFCSLLDKKFREPDYYHSVSINSTFADKSQLAATLLHEIGHCFEEQLNATAERHNLEIFPSHIETTDEEGYEDFQADLIACHILYPEALEANKETSLIGETSKAIELMFEGTDFSEARRDLERLTEAYKKTLQTQPDETKPMPSWLKYDHGDRTFLLRVFEKAKHFPSV